MKQEAKILSFSEVQGFSLWYITISTIVIYAISYLSGQFNAYTSIASLLITLLICYLLRHKLSFSKSKVSYLVLIFCVFYLASVAYVLSPLAVTQKLNNFDFLRYVGIGDYYKHSYTVTSIRETGVPPKHPYFPNINFSYYYGYYLLPSAISTLVGISPNIVILIYIIITSFLSLSLLQTIIWGLIKNQFTRFVTFGAILFGTGMDIVPMYFADHLKVDHIENWLSQVGNGQAVENIYSSLIWTPQHLFASVISVYLVYLLFKKKFSYLFFIPAFIYVISSSIFIALTLALWMVMYLFLENKNRFQLILSGFVTAILMLPFLLSLRVSQNLIYAYHFTPIPDLALHLGSRFLEALTKLVIYLVVENGFLFVGLVYMLLSSRISPKLKISILISVYLPRIIAFFFRSPGVNDLSLKILQPITIAVPVLFFYLAENYFKNSVRQILVWITVFFVGFGCLGNLFEVYNLWKNRKIYSFEESSLQYRLRELPRGYRILAINKDEWVFLIPVLGQKIVVSASPFDSNVYISKKPDFVDGISYEKARDTIFLDVVTATGSVELIQKENHSLSQINDYLIKYPADGIVLPEKEWVKKGKNVWYEVFSQLGVRTVKSTPGFLVFDYQDALKKIKEHPVSLDPSNAHLFYIKNRQVFMEKGIYFIYSCSETPNQEVSIELERYFTLFDEKLEKPQTCIGKLFFNTESENIEVSSKTSVSNFFAVPLKINQTKLNKTN